MSKDPAFLFYPNDFASGTQVFNFEERGMYLELLILQFNSPTGSITLSQIKRILNGRFEECWAFPLKDKFQQDDNGFYNSRLREETRKRRDYSESRRNNRLNPDKKEEKSISYDEHMNNICSSRDEHMGNGNGNENEDLNEIEKGNKKSKNFTKPSIQEISDYLKSIEYDLEPQLFYDFYESKGWLIGKNKMRDWKAAVRTWKSNDKGKNNGSNKTNINENPGSVSSRLAYRDDPVKAAKRKRALEELDRLHELKQSGNQHL